MDKALFSPTTFILFLIISRLMSIVGKLKTWNSSLPYEILSLDIATRLSSSPDSVAAASSDFGNMVQRPPAAVLYPASAADIVDLVQFSYNSSSPFPVAARGRGHSARGQASAMDGVVVEMSSLKRNSSDGIRVSWSESLGFYADVGGHELWVDVLRASLEHGLAPVSWTDYLYLTVGGTLSNAGISGQSFRYGPQIANVHEMDVITGKKEDLTAIS